jgi:hypothetical protein
MIPNHKQFIEAIQQKKKVCLRFYSTADSGVIDLVCAPMDYGPIGEPPGDVNKYQLWDYTSNTGSPVLVLLPGQVLDLRLLGELFDPAQIGFVPARWHIARDWGLPSGAGPASPVAPQAQTEKHNSPNEASQFVKN